MSALLIGSYVLIGDEARDALPQSHTLTPPSAHTAEQLDILEIVPTEVTPGSAIEVRFAGADTSPGAPALSAQLSQPQHDRWKAEFEVLSRRGDVLVLRVPAGAKTGAAKVRLFQAEQKSKPYDLRIEQLNRRKMFRSIVGGLALLVFGLTTLSAGARAYSGRRLQGLFSRVAKRTPAALLLGVMVGGITQFTTTAAGLVVGLIDSHLLATVPAAAVLLGAQLGAAATPSVLGLASTREGLLVTAIGVLWLSLAIDRRGRAIGQIILGTGLLFYGLHTLRTGFEPLVSDPALLQHIEIFNADSVVGLLACALAGIVLATLLQSPAPVFVIVLGLAESTGRLDLQSALAILAGTGLGAAFSAAVVAWPFGIEPRRLAKLNLVAAALGTLLLISSVNLWSFVADALLAGSPAQVDYGKKVLLPNLGRHLVLAFMLSQTAVAVMLAVALPTLATLLRGFAPGNAVDGRAAVSTIGHAPDSLRSSLTRVLRVQRGALIGVFDLWLSGDRTRGVQSEHALSDARAELEAMLADSRQTGASDASAALLRRAATAALQLQRAAEALLQQAETSMEQRLALSPDGAAWQQSERDTSEPRAMQALLLAGVDDALAALTEHTAPDLDRARTREIQLNALELASRRTSLANTQPAADASASALHLAAADLANAYEVVGNHLYRLCETLASEVDQDSGLPAEI